MNRCSALEQMTIAVSVSESPEMPTLGLGPEHLRDAMVEIARHLLALGAGLVYGGDLRANGFTELLFELVARYRKFDIDVDDQRMEVRNYFAWPVHISMPAADILKIASDLEGLAEPIYLALDGKRLSTTDRVGMPIAVPTDEDWRAGLTAMRDAMSREAQARIVLGGRVDKYKGAMPGVAEEALLSLQNRQPMFLLGGFGGCTRDIAETLGLVPPSASHRDWEKRSAFGAFTERDLCNGLTLEENCILAKTPHVDQAISLILRGLLRLWTLSSRTV